jgi:EAL domain-containing protein (putative c-di-GMP-specific phosphodiesterase class I)
VHAPLSPEALRSFAAEVRRALAGEELRVHYQPIVSAADRRVAAVEALVRWEHPERGLLSPAAFIPAAECAGMVAAIDRWVFDAACRQFRAWEGRFQEPRGWRLHVNLSADGFSNPALADEYGAILLQTGMDAGRVMLEMTESCELDTREDALEIAAAVRRLGIRFCIDDFGIGYSSLRYVERFPVAMLKIDRSFVSRIASSQRCEIIIHHVLRLAWRLGIGVTAEGVETAEQMTTLKRLRCEYVQGYLFARPLHPREFEDRFLRSPQPIG